MHVAITIFPDVVKYIKKRGSFLVSTSMLSVLSRQTMDFPSYSTELKKFNIFTSIAPNDAPIGRIGAEGYTLVVSNDDITISANTETGCFYGFQTLRWLLLTQDYQGKDMIVDSCEIVDYPRFPYRGYMLDEARYFLGMNMVRSIIDWMALLKLNRFHWHLTEDQGWRVEIKQYPSLTTIGSKREGTPRYRNRQPPIGEDSHDGTPHGGFYTQDQIKELIDYAARRHVTVIPEFEIPGHATAALASYPEMRCILPDDLPPEGADIFGHHLDGKNIKVSSKWGVHANLFCASNPKTVAFIKDVLSEFASLFPGPVIHIGGDEVPKAQWMCCERCQEKIESMSLASEEDLQKVFTAEIVDYLASLGKKTMLWNEHTDESLAERKDNVICQYWTGSPEKINSFLERDGKVIMSPSSHVYVDLAYYALPLKKVYHYDPLGFQTLQAISDVAAEKAAAGGILGVEAPMWGEVYQNKAQVEYCTFPRVLAIADIGWVQQDGKNYSRFVERVVKALDVLDLLRINHASLPDADPSEESIDLAKKDPKFGRYMYF